MSTGLGFWCRSTKADIKRGRWLSDDIDEELLHNSTTSLKLNFAWSGLIGNDIGVNTTNDILCVWFLWF